MIILLLLLAYLLIPKPIATQAVEPVVQEPIVEPVTIQTEQVEPVLEAPNAAKEQNQPQTQAKSVKPLEQPLNSSQNTEHTPIEAPIEPAEPEPTFPPGTCTTCSYKINVGDKPTDYELEQLRKYQEQDYQ